MMKKWHIIPRVNYGKMAYNSKGQLRKNGTLFQKVNQGKWSKRGTQESKQTHTGMQQAKVNQGNG